jgi:hypothetical protein
MTMTSPSQNSDNDAQPSTMNSQPSSFLTQIKEIMDFEEEMAEAKSLPLGKHILRQHEAGICHS